MTAKKPPSISPVAKKHPSHYLMHKYWARKPYNVVRTYIEYFTSKNGIVMDPFAGSGVTSIEAIKAGRKAISVDINPISNHIINGTCNVISASDFDRAITTIGKNVSTLSDSLYTVKCYECKKKSLVNYTVWSQSIQCDACKEKFLVIYSEKNGRKYQCTKCNHPNKTIYTVKRNEIPAEIKYHCDKCKKNFIHKLNKNEIRSILKIQEKYNKTELLGQLVYNPRTLIEKNMKVSDLFTPRNLTILNTIKYEIKKIPDPRLRQVMDFIFTASVAQSSRLIAYRAGLTTGGPAWTISGFWIPPISMEINPLKNFINKAKKVRLGKAELSNKIDELGLSNYEPPATFSELKNSNQIMIINKSINAISEKVIPSSSVDYMFTDPPYGDSVPYLEYCALWSSWLDNKLDYKNEIIISDSPDREKTLEDYSSLISKGFLNCYRILKDNSWISVTFHNRSLETWEVLLNAIKKAGFTYTATNYLVPVVLPAKAQLSEGSLEGDLVIHFKKSTASKPSSSKKVGQLEKEIINRAEQVLTFMEGKSRSSQIWNSIMLLLLENQFDEFSHVKIKPLLKSQFEFSKGYWKITNPKRTKSQKTFKKTVEFICKKTKKTTDEQGLVAEIYNSIPVWLAPPISEVKKEIRALKKEKSETLENFF